MLIMSVRGYAKLIKSQRTSLGITQERMASELGVSRRWLMDFENGKVANPGFDTVLRALHLVGMALDVQRTTVTPAISDKLTAHNARAEGEI